MRTQLRTWITLTPCAQRFPEQPLLLFVITNPQVDRKVAMEVLDVECMQAAGLIIDIEQWRRKEVRFNTRTLYTVNK